MMKNVFLLLSAALLVTACAHSSGTGQGGEAKDPVRADDAGEEDSILRTFERPPVKKKAEPRPERDAEPEGKRSEDDDLDRRAEREDSLVEAMEPRQPRPEAAGEERETEPNELDMNEVREDPILSGLDSKDQRSKKKAKKKKKKKEEAGRSRM